MQKRRPEGAVLASPTEFPGLLAAVVDDVEGDLGSLRATPMLAFSVLYELVMNGPRGSAVLNGPETEFKH